MTPTPDPTPCRDRVPGGPGCPTESPGATPTTAPVELPDDGGVGSGVAGVLDTVLDVLPWVLVALLAVAVVALLLVRRRPAPASTPVPVAVAVPAQASSAPPRVATPVPQPQAPSGALPPGHLGELLTLADLATTPAVAAQVRRVLRGLGVEPLEPAVGTPLDLDLHEVVATTPAPDPGHHERVARVHRPGWRRGHEVLRPAAVELWVAPPVRPPAGPPA